MDAPSILIAGFSGRALAQSARRAGYLPLVADAFGDEDTRALALASEVVPGALQRGFRSKPLLGALSRLAARAPTPPIGLVLGTGFEDRPALIAELTRTFTLIGCAAEAVAAAKDPTRLFAVARDLGIPHPATDVTPPDSGRGWISKRVGGTGGTHIARCRATVAPRAGRYFQREETGEPLSMLGVVGRTSAFAFTRSWLAPMPRRPFRFGGIAGSVDVEPDIEARLIETGLDLTRALGLVGLVSFDFLVTDEGPLLIEINPRPSASLDVLDDESGTLFSAHLAAFETGDPAGVLAQRWQPRPRAIAYLYADDGAVTAPAAAWSEWTSDRPRAGTVIPLHAPALTVHAAAATPDTAAAEAVHRLGAAKAVLYGQEKSLGKETPR
ncbi:MAG: ATP-grasp domain-containing protein [Hyphomicrobiaceae bacterium]